jgi:hypothetical protein
MSARLKLTFADSMRQGEFEIAVQMVQTFGMTYPSGGPRTLTVVPNPGQLEALKKHLAIWEDDGLLTIAGAT